MERRVRPRRGAAHGDQSGARRGRDRRLHGESHRPQPTRHADVILPPSWALTEDHVVVFASVFIRNVARWSPPVVSRGDGELADWETLLELTKRLGGGPTGMPWMDRLLRAASFAGYRDVEAIVGQSILNGVPVRLYRRCGTASDDAPPGLSATG